MPEDPVARSSARRKTSRPHGEGAGIERPGQPIGRGIGVHVHGADVVTEDGTHVTGDIGSEQSPAADPRSDRPLDLRVDRKTAEPVLTVLPPAGADALSGPTGAEGGIVSSATRSASRSSGSSARPTLSFGRTRC